jgi:carboxyl-terminal processing protease
MRSVLLLTATFLAGMAAHPALDLMARQISGALTINSALAQDDADQGGTYRLLTLFGDVFELVRSEYVDPVSEKELMAYAINGMITGLDPHSAYLNAEEFHEMQIEDEGTFSGIGIELAQDEGFLKVLSRMNNAPAARAGIKVGDIIIALNGKPVRDLSAQHIMDRLRGPPNTRVTLTIRRQNVDYPLEIAMRRAIIHIPVVTQRLEPNAIGYVRITEFSELAEASLKQAVRSLKRQAGGNLKALVLDLRDNPGGLVDEAVAVAREFIRKGEIVSTRSRYRDDSQWLAGKGKDILGGAPIVLLINGGSASASEVVAGALQDHRRAVLVGTRSFGKGSVQATFPLAGGGAMLLTTARYYTPSGRSIQGRGIIPDVLVEETPVDVRQFGPEHEADLYHMLTNAGGTPDIDEPRTDLPPIARAIPSRPPKDFPEFDPVKPDTDFQLQQALVVARAMVAVRKGTNAN